MLIDRKSIPTHKSLLDVFVPASTFVAFLLLSHINDAFFEWAPRKRSLQRKSYLLVLLQDQLALHLSRARQQLRVSSQLMLTTPLCLITWPVVNSSLASSVQKLEQLPYAPAFVPRRLLSNGPCIPFFRLTRLPVY